MKREEALRLALLCRDRAPATENDWMTISLDALADFAAQVAEAARDECARNAARTRER